MENNTLDDSYREMLNLSEAKEADDWISQFDPELQAEQEAKEQPATSFWDTAGKVASDIGGGLVEAPGQIMAAPGRVAQSLMSGSEAFDSWMQSMVPLGGIQILDEDGNFAPDLVSGEQLIENREQGVGTTEVPEVFGKAETVTGGLIGGLSQFLVGFKGADKALSSLGVTFGKAGAPILSQLSRAQLQAAITDFAAFEGKEKNLADLIEMVPALENPVTEYLSEKTDDGEFEQRLKNVMAGQVPDTILSGITVALRSIKAARRAKALTGADTYEQAAGKLAADARADQPGEALREADLTRIDETLGRVDDDLVIVAKGKLDEADAARVDEKVVNTGDPVIDDIANALVKTDTPEPPKGGLKIETGGNDVYVNLARINSSDDVKTVIKQLADADQAGIEKATRGVRSNAQTQEAAGNENAWKVLIGERAGNLPRAEEQLALRRLWAASGQKFMEVAQLATREPTAENLFALRKASSVHNAVQREVIGVRTETARALQQWAIPAGGSKEQLLQMQSILDQHGGAEVTLAMAERIAALAGKPGMEHAIDQLARKTPFAQTMDGVRAYWINSILSGPKTHAVNVLSNTAVIMNSIAERAIAGRIADLTSDVDGVRIGEAMAMWWGVKQSWVDALRYAGKAFMSGETGMGRGKLELARTRTLSAETFGATTNANFNALVNKTWLGKALDYVGTVVESPGRALTAEDEFFKTINYRAELWGQAFRTASDEAERGLIPRDALKQRMMDIISDPPENIKIQAADMAAYNTFTNEPGSIVQQVMRFRESVPGMGYIIPFINTPANIMKYTFERTPLAPLSAKFRADLASGGARRNMALAKIGVGTMAITTVYDIAMNGHFTGSGPREPRRRSALRRTGWQPYSVRIPKGTDKNGNPTYAYVAYNRLDPLGTIVGISADLAEWQLNTDQKADDQFNEIFAAATFSIAENLKDKSYFRGLADLVEAINNPDRFSERYFNRFVGSFIPAAVNEVTKFTDPHLKYTHDTLSQVKSRIPGLSQDIPNRVDFWGREIKFQSGLGKLYDATSPIYVSQSKLEPIDEELLRLKYSPGHASYVRIDGKNVPMRNQPQAYIAFSKYSGGTTGSEMASMAEVLKIQMGLNNREMSDSVIQRLQAIGDKTALQYLNDVVTNKHPDSLEYAVEDDDGKQDFIRKVMRDFHKAAKYRVIDEFPELKEIRSRMEE